MNIVFMGTPDFAAPCLLGILEGGHNVPAVFSQPDRPKGRGQSLLPTPVKELALDHEIPVFQPERLRDGAVLEILRGIGPDLIVVVAYGRILPKEILELPPLGCVNIHASLLPRLRGAAPIQWSVINGDHETGVTSMFMAEGLDTGDIILQKSTVINHGETSGELFARLAAMGADILSETLPLLETGKAPRQTQDDSLATHAPPIPKSLGRLDFVKPPSEISNLVRGLNPSPAAFAKLRGKTVKILRAEPAEGLCGKPGEIIDPRELIVGCGGGALRLLEICPEGKKPMTGAEFARGKRLAAGEMFTQD